MKTLANHQLIYDQDCPLCTVYSGAFIKAKMLDENGRQNFRELRTETKCLLDEKRAKNEIALVDFSNQKVYYGLDSLLIIIGNSFPFLEKIGRISFIYWFFQKFYSLVSYNRKQIIPSKTDSLANACVPDFNLKYRFIFLIFGIGFSAFLLSSISFKFDLQVNFISAILLQIGLFSIQIGWIMNKSLEQIFNYLGNLNTLFLATSFLLFLFSMVNLPVFVNQILLLLTLVVLMLEYRRRINILNKK